MKDILVKICKKKKEEIEYKKNKCSIKTLKKLLPIKKNRGFKNLLSTSQINKKNNIIAEIKKKSPSAGEIITNYKPEEIAVQYEQSGVGAISILTENNFFGGNIDHLSSIHNTIKIPILRKDFIIDEYQIYESKVYKADAILLILAILTNDQIKDYISIAKEIGIDCLIEVHSISELERAIKINYPIIGINNRNLKNLSIDTNNTLKLIKQIPKKFIIVGESGIKNKEDITHYNDQNIFNFLIGESILKSTNIDEKIKELLK